MFCPSQTKTVYPCFNQRRAKVTDAIVDAFMDPHRKIDATPRSRSQTASGGHDHN